MAVNRMNKQIAWILKQRMKNGLINSYKGNKEDFAHLYDQAVAIIALIHAGKYPEARRIIDRLRRLQNRDGSWYSCYNGKNKRCLLGNPDDIGRHSGPIAWVLMALNLYEHKTRDKRYAAMIKKILNWLEGMRNKDTSEGNFGSYKYGTESPSKRVSTEHNYDIYSALRYRAILSKDQNLLSKAKLVRRYLVNKMWAPSPTSNGPYRTVAVFWRGYKDYQWCTDPQSWGVLALGNAFRGALIWLHSRGYSPIYHRRYGSTRVDNPMLIGNKFVDGYCFCTENVVAPNKKYPAFCGGKFIWLEGTLGVASAFYFIGDNRKGDYYFSQATKVVLPDGGVPYSVSNLARRWPCNYRYGSLASTGWYYLVQHKFNPFAPF
ncbi:MAG: hypothetical protein ABIE74_05305 [Pseudomonadota bacterium]